jgi:hypothetical protein
MLRPPPFALALALLASHGVWVRAADDAALRPFSVIRVEPAKTSIYIGSVTLTAQPFIRKPSGYSSTYVARVFPYYFISERGRLSVHATDEMLRRAARGESVEFEGLGINENGDERKIEGRATPTGPSRGRMQVRIHVSKHILLTFNTVYTLPNAKSAPIQVQ